MRRVLVFAVVVSALGVAAGAGATAGPIGPLPKGPTTTISTTKGQLVSVALPKGAKGRVWRQANVVDQKVLHEVTESDVSSGVVIVFKAVGTGSTKVVYGLTRGETAKAYASATFVVKVG